MSKRLAIIGGSGLIGKAFLHQVEGGQYKSVLSLGRRKLDELTSDLIKQEIVDLENESELKSHLDVDILVCTLGTTIKNAGSEERFHQIDHGIPLLSARLAKALRCEHFILVTAAGAHANSKFFYNRVKGELESDIKALGFPTLHILRPGLLLGDREESRPAERVAQLIMKPLRAIMPKAARPIKDNELAGVIHHCAMNPTPGDHILQGSDLFKLT